MTERRKQVRDPFGGHELEPEEQARRLRIVTRIGMIMLPALFIFIVFAAFGGLHLFRG